MERYPLWAVHLWFVPYNKTRTKMTSHLPAIRRKTQQVATIAAGIAVLATAAAVVIHRRRQRARVLHSNQKASSTFRPALQITLGPELRLEMYNEVWCKEFLRY